MKTIKLEATYEFDFSLIGIVSNAKDFKLAWNINQSLGIELEKQDDIRLEFSNNSFMLISNYLSDNGILKIELLKNKLIAKGNLSNQQMIPELKEFDYLIKFKDLSDEWTISWLLSKLKEIPIIEYVTNLKFDNIKSKENLLY